MAQSRKRFTPFTLDNGWNVEFPTEPGGILRLGPGKVHVAARLSERYRSSEDWFTVIDCEVRIADADGKLWQATGTCQAEWLLYPLTDPTPPEPGCWLHNAPQEWRTALKKRSLIRDQ